MERWDLEEDGPLWEDEREKCNIVRGIYLFVLFVFSLASLSFSFTQLPNEGLTLGKRGTRSGTYLSQSEIANIKAQLLAERANATLQARDGQGDYQGYTIVSSGSSHFFSCSGDNAFLGLTQNPQQVSF